MLRPCFPPTHGRFCEAVDAPTPHPCRSPPAGGEVGRLDPRRVGSFRAVRALGLGGPGAPRSLLMGRFTHRVTWAGFVGKEPRRQRSSLPRVPGERRAAPVY